MKATTGKMINVRARLTLLTLKIIIPDTTNAAIPTKKLIMLVSILETLNNDSVTGSITKKDPIKKQDKLIPKSISQIFVYIVAGGVKFLTYSRRGMTKKKRIMTMLQKGIIEIPMSSKVFN